jgi:hypothetical protein
VVIAWGLSLVLSQSKKTMYDCDAIGGGGGGGAATGAGFARAEGMPRP